MPRKINTEVGHEKDHTGKQLIEISALLLAELVSCEKTALTGAPREGFCQAPVMDAKTRFENLLLTNDMTFLACPRDKC